MVEFRRKLYKRGSSFETTIPIQMLFSIDIEKKHNVIFQLDNESQRWYIKFEETKESAAKRGGKKR